MSNSLVELVVARPKQGIHFWPYPLYNTCRVAIIISTHCYTFNYIFTLCICVLVRHFYTLYMCSRQTCLHFVYVFSSGILRYYINIDHVICKTIQKTTTAMSVMLLSGTMLTYWHRAGEIVWDVITFSHFTSISWIPDLLRNLKKIVPLVLA